jgi:dynactin complex subunit
MEPVEIGTRVALANKRGNVQFCGHLKEVDGGKEQWLGIDWDNAEDGKHNGSYKGVQYFKTK